VNPCGSDIFLPLLRSPVASQPRRSRTSLPTCCRHRQRRDSYRAFKRHAHTRLVEGLLFGVSPTDPTVIVAVMLLVGTHRLLATGPPRGEC